LTSAAEIEYNTKYNIMKRVEAIWSLKASTKYQGYH
jgi:hypothetical protein